MNNRDGAAKLVMPMKYGPDLTGYVAYGLRTGYLITECRVCWQRIASRDLHHQLNWRTGHQDRVHTDCFEEMIRVGHYAVVDGVSWKD